MFTPRQHSIALDASVFTFNYKRASPFFVDAVEVALDKRLVNIEWPCLSPDLWLCSVPY